MEVQDQTRSRIIMTAQQLFHQFGFHKVSVDEIVRNLGISKKTLYKYFSSKEALIVSIIEAHSDEINTHIMAIVDEDELSFFEKLEKIMSTLHSYHQHMSPNMMHDLAKYMPEVHQHLMETARPKIQGNFRKMFVTGIKEGVFRDDIDPDILLLLQSILMEKMFTPEVLANVSLSSCEVHAMIKRIILEGILTTRGRTEHTEVMSRMKKHHSPMGMVL